MATATTQRVAGWVLEERTQLYHYYQAEPGQEAHPAACDGPVLITRAIRLHGAVLPPAELTTRYTGTNGARKPGICRCCWGKFQKQKR